MLVSVEGRVKIPVFSTILLMTAFVLPLAPTQLKAEDRPAVNVLRATVQVLIKDKQNNTLGTGSGVIVSSKGYILTAKHVLNEYFKSPETRRVVVRLPNQNLMLLSENSVAVVSQDPNVDMALLHLPTIDLPFLKFGNSSLLEMHDRLMASGFGAGSETVLSKFGHRSGLTWEVDNPLSEGFSGGPVVKDGCDVLVGIVVGGLENSSGIISGRSQIIPSQYGAMLFAQANSTQSETLCSESSSTNLSSAAEKKEGSREPPPVESFGCKEVTVSERINGVLTWSKKCL